MKVNKPTPFFIGALVLLAMVAMALLPLVAIAQSTPMEYRTVDGCFEGDIVFDPSPFEDGWDYVQFRYYEMRTSETIVDEPLPSNRESYRLAWCGDYGYWSIQIRLGNIVDVWGTWNQSFVVHLIEMDNVVRPNPPTILEAT